MDKLLADYFIQQKGLIKSSNNLVSDLNTLFNFDIEKTEFNTDKIDLTFLNFD